MRSIYRALTETEDSVSTAGAPPAGRNESQSADLFQELQREVARTSVSDGAAPDFITHVLNVDPIKSCLHCPTTVLGDGEAAGSYGNGPFPPFLPPPHDSGSSGTTSPDLPASSVSFLRLCLLRHLLFGGEAGVAPSQPRPPTAPFQKQPLQPEQRLPGAPHLRPPGRAGRHASSDPAQGPHLLPARLPLLFPPPAGAAELLLHHRPAPAPGRRLPSPRVWTPGSSGVFRLVLTPPALIAALPSRGS